MCLIAAAHPDLYLPASNIELIIPADTLEFDLRGRIDVPSTGDFAYIDVGQVKAVGDYKQAVQQLGSRLGALKWLSDGLCTKHCAHDRSPLCK
jgi:hypothetical protein